MMAGYRPSTGTACGARPRSPCVVFETHVKKAVAGRAANLGWHTVAVTASPLPGPSGNVEYFLRLRAQTDQAQTVAPLHGEELATAVTRAIEEGPQ